MAHGDGRRFGGSDPSGWAVGSGNAGEIPAGFGPDAVTPAGATIPSWRVSVISIPHLPPRAGETLGHVRAAASSASLSFLEVLFCTRWFGASGCSGLSLVGVAVAGHPRSVELPLLAFASFLFLGLLCSSPQRSCIGVGCFGIQSGGKPFFSNYLFHRGQEC